VTREWTGVPMPSRSAGVPSVLLPGDGELPLAAFVAALAPDGWIGLEVPICAKADAGISPFERLQSVVTAAQALIRTTRN
jgi:hypothetical protein